ncbi:MAG: glycosyltransferase family 4 protein [Planctomycetota bacterium]|nr:glycosyltransferase family 4 protein [Planctomycetota bacterium]
MRILLLNQCFFPDIVSTAQISHDLATYLVAHGHHVTAVSSRSIYGEAGDSLPAHETVDGIDIHRVKGAMFGKRGILLRVVDFGAFYVRAFCRVVSLPRHDVVVSLTTPPFISLVGIMAGWIKGNRTAYWVMDLYPDLPLACGVLKPRSPVTWLTERVNRFCLRHSTVTVALGRCMRDLILSKGIPAERVRTIQVWSDQEAVRPVPRESNAYRREWGVGDRLLVMYSGNFGLGHDVQTFLDAAKRLQGDDRIRFAFVGGGKKKAEVEAFVKSRFLANCVLAPYQPRERLDELLSAADVHLASLSDGIEGIMVPSKLYGMMAAARASIFIGRDTGEVALTIVEQSCGTVIGCGNVDALVAAIQQYAADPSRAMEEGQRGRAAVERLYTKDSLCAAWMSTLEEAASRRRAGARAGHR